MPATLQDIAQELSREGLLLSAPASGSDELALPISGADSDSRFAAAGHLFIAKGAAFKEAYLLSALEKGCVAYLCEAARADALANVAPGVPALVVSDVRRAMGVVSPIAWGHPDLDLDVIGITGTKGKSTATYMLRAILDGAETGSGTGIMGSIDTYDGVENFESVNTTPEAPDLWRHVANTRAAGLGRLVMEVSSQALKYDRTLGLTFGVGCFLNLGRDHISPIEHPDFEDYFQSKLKIFAQSKVAVVNLETDRVDDVLAAASSCERVLRFSAEGPQVLIVHTHTSEAYTPSDGNRYEASDTMRTQDPNFNILRVGDVLSAHLEEAGLSVLHDCTVNDYPSYAGAYSRSGAVVEQALAEHPSIRMVIDLHRDALCSDTVVYKTVAELPDAEPCAQVMFVVGTDSLGLEHPDWRENLKLAVWLQNAVSQRHPTLLRPIDLVRERYNQHLSRGMMLIEIGSSGNTLPEAVRAAELLGDAMGSALSTLIENGS
jgi:stage II sporulation protein P